MPWVIGIDEAGYGPNLGPLVQAAAKALVPASDLAGWQTFHHAVRRAHEPVDHRLLVDDSKTVYRGGAGFENLAATLRGWGQRGSLHDLIGAYGVDDSYADVQTEHWWRPESLADLPGSPCPLINAGLIPTRLNVVVPRRMNQIIDETGSKAAALFRGYLSLVRSTLQFHFNRHGVDWLDGHDVVIIADKHGGRHYYSALLQETFPDGWVITEHEAPSESRYRIEGLPFGIRAIFRPKADRDSICVALASMMAKYIRELCMRQFNDFWARHVPGLVPTAGYPVDARRFYHEIEQAMTKLGIEADRVWRRK